MSARATYTKDQITKYFNRLGLPEEQRNYDVSELSPEDTLQYLTLLQKLQLATIPFENINLHYSTHHSVSVHPEALFRKVIGDNNGRGGYCMENNRLFGTLLNSLGFTLYSGGARVFGDGAWTGWSHMVNLVTIGEKKYHVDVGFCADGPTIPMPLEACVGASPMGQHPGKHRPESTSLGLRVPEERRERLGNQVLLQRTGVPAAGLCHDELLHEYQQPDLLH
jgi:arylamine N-acetyltransferase